MGFWIKHGVKIRVVATLYIYGSDLEYSSSCLARTVAALLADDVAVPVELGTCIVGNVIVETAPAPEYITVTASTP